MRWKVSKSTGRGKLKPLRMRSGARLTIGAKALLEVLDLSLRRVLAAGTEQIAKGVEAAAAVAALVEERESLLVVGRSLGVKLVRCHCA